MIGRSRHEDEDDGGVLVADDERPSGAMAENRENSIPGTIR
jgi:hypothetical protein